MNDDRLASELERRASAVSPRPDWARRDLLPAVWHEIDARPQPVLASRWSPLASLATLVVAVLVVAVAAPRLVPAPPTSSSSPTESAPPVPAQTGVLSTAEFASRLAAGELDGETVLVNGRIGPNLRDGLPCLPSGRDWALCYLGPLEGVEPPLDVQAHWIETNANETTSGTGLRWDRWHFRLAPLEGVLLLSVDVARRVVFGGLVRESEQGLAWSIADAAALDINLLGRDEVVLVDGWLVETEPPGTTISIDCMSPPFPPADGLPYNYCLPQDYLSSEQPVDALPPDGAARLSVQRNAAQLFGARIQDGTSLFAIAPRLYGGCFDAPTCWQWDVVARVDTSPRSMPPTPPPKPTPTLLPAMRTIECSDTNTAAGPVQIEDHTGLVSGCQTGGSEAPDEPVLTSTRDPAELVISWLVPCVVDTDSTRIELWHRKSTASDVPYLLAVDRTQPEHPPGCLTMVTGRQVRITLREPLSAADVELLFTSNGHDGDNVEQPPHIVNLDLDAANATLALDGQVDVTAALTYWGGEDAVPVSGLSVDFRIEQLDGPLSLLSGPTTLMCTNQGQLELAEPRTFSLADAYLVSSESRDSVNAYDPDPFVLPPGVYHVHVSVGFVIGEMCIGDRIELEASVVVTVR